MTDEANGSALATTADKKTEIEKARDAATVVPQMLVDDLIRSVGTLDGGKLQRWQVRVPVFAKHQYLIPGRRIPPERGVKDAKWMGEYSAGLRAEGYDWLNRVMGVQFFTPPTVHNRDGKEVPNPIHSRDYLYHREIAIGYSETGQMLVQAEDIELDFRMQWEAERLKQLLKLVKPKKAKGSDSDDQGDPQWEGLSENPPTGLSETFPTAAEVVRTAGTLPPDLLLRDEYGAPKMGPNGELLFHLPDFAEVEAAQRLITLRNYGGRQAKTIAQRRLLARFSAIRTLWSAILEHKPELSTQWVWVTGWRDDLTPDERLVKAQAEARSVFGASMAEHEHPVDQEEVELAAEEVEGELVEQAQPLPPEPKPGVPDPATTQAQRDDLAAKAKAGVIPGVTVGMPGEKLSKAICGERDVVGPNPCTREPNHKPKPHQSLDGVWPSEPVQ